MVGLVLWTVLRAASVWGVLQEYGVNPWIFLAIDVLTVPPYSWGLREMGRTIVGGGKLKRLYLGGIAALLGFIAPYAYLYASGYGSIPLSTQILIGLIIVVLFGVGPFRHLMTKFGKARA